MPFAWRRNTTAQLIALLHDTAMIPIAWFSAYWLRYNLEPIPETVLQPALEILPLLLFIQVASYSYFGLYKGMWRFASLPDLTRILKAVGVGVLFALLAFFLLFRGENIPRSIFPLYTILLVCGLSASRLAFRWLKDRARFTLVGTRVLIIGAGKAGEGLARDLLRNRTQGYIPVAFVDDAERHFNREVYGVRIVGRTIDIPTIVSKYGIDLIMIAIPSANAADMRRMVALCELTDCAVRTLPNVTDIMQGLVAATQLREIQLDDLLGRDPVRLDWHRIGQHLANNSILVSGGGGSIGSELCRQILTQRPKRLIVIDCSEYNLFVLERELRNKAPACCELICRLMDVCDTPAIDDLFARYHIDMIFHAAAYKHVPILEGQVREAARNNVLGTYGLARAAMQHKVGQFVLVSTDKAVNPTNVMGASKRVAERLCVALNNIGSTRFTTVRFGNVLGSRGSVVEIFKQQLKQGGPLTVTHPDVTRFFMTIPEAAQLILQASCLGSGGEIYMLDMGEPVAIRYLAEQMIKLSGKKLGSEIEIRYTGLRPGEKLTEELIHESEQVSQTGHPKIFKLISRPEALSCDRWIAKIEYGCKHYDEIALIETFSELVPEFEASDTATRSSKSQHATFEKGAINVDY